MVEQSQEIRRRLLTERRAAADLHNWDKRRGVLAAMLLFYPMGFHVLLLYVASAVVGFNFGGNFALFPSATADFFCNKNVGANYAWVFTAYGVGGIIGPLLVLCQTLIFGLGAMATLAVAMQQWRRTNNLAAHMLTQA